jgi:hypothetical protein
MYTQSIGSPDGERGIPFEYVLLKGIIHMVYFAMRGGSRKKIAKKIIPSVPTSRKV